MSTALQAYRHVAASDEFKERERMWSKARHDEAQALLNAELRGAEKERGKWQDIVDEKDALISELQAQLGKK